MKNFEDFYMDLTSLVKKYESENIPIKIEEDIENNIIKIFGENISSLSRARNGFRDLFEHVCTTAEHHPYWNLLNNCSEIIDIVLEKWTGVISRKDISDIEWSLKKLEQNLERLKSSQKQ